MTDAEGAVCACGHERASHPFGSSGYLISDGRCSGCGCRGFKPSRVRKFRKPSELTALRAFVVAASGTRCRGCGYYRLPGRMCPTDGCVVGTR